MEQKAAWQQEAEDAREMPGEKSVPEGTAVAGWKSPQLLRAAL